jgi:hypothetical protein
MMMAATVVATAAAALHLWSVSCEFPMHVWNEVRLAPAFGFRQGINPYPLIGEGPLSTWIYGPVGLLFNLPATFATSAAMALTIASVINALSLVLPLAVIFFTASELRERGPAVRWLGLALAVLLLPRTSFLFHVADHTATACGVLSCWLLARDPHPGGARMLVPAALCAFAIWSKQIAVFLLPAQIAFLLLGGKRATAVRYGASVAGFSTVLLVLFAQQFGLVNLWLNLVNVPARLPWADTVERFALRRWTLIGTVAAPVAGLLVLWRTRVWPARACESGRFFQLAVLASGAMLPIGLAGFVKFGGDTNVIHSWVYLLPAALLAWLAAERIRMSAARRICAVALAAIALHASQLRSIPTGPLNDHLALGARLSAAFPHSIWFPHNPLITWYADRALWHVEDGIVSRDLAGYGLRESEFRRHLPPRLEALAYPAYADTSYIRQLLPELSVVERSTYWTIYTRSTKEHELRQRRHNAATNEPAAR